MPFESVVRVTGLAGLSLGIVYLGYLFWEKNVVISVILVVVGIAMAIYLIRSEEEFKRQRHANPIVFRDYKGE